MNLTDLRTAFGISNKRRWSKARRRGATRRLRMEALESRRMLAVVGITVGEVNEPPLVSLVNAVMTLAEDADTTNRTQVAEVVITDDGTGTNGLALSGADANLFEIDAGVVYLQAGAPLDFETNPVLDATIEVDDAAVGSAPDSTAPLAVNITDVLEGWQNPVNPMDLNNDTHVFPNDVLVLVNELNSPKYIDSNGTLPLVRPKGAYYFDGNGDGYLTPVGDVLPLVNFINTGGGAERESGGRFPEQLVLVSANSPGGTSRTLDVASQGSGLPFGDGRGAETAALLDRYFAADADAELTTIRITHSPSASEEPDDDLETVLAEIAPEVGTEWNDLT